MKLSKFTVNTVLNGSDLMLDVNKINSLLIKHHSPLFCTFSVKKLSTEIQDPEFIKFVEDNVDKSEISLVEFINLVGKYLNIQPVYILSHAILESGWGKSRIAHKTNNLFGFDAVDDDPNTPENETWLRVDRFESFAHCVFVVMSKIKRLYLTEGGKYYSKTFGPTLRGMAEHYATDENWAMAIAKVANMILRNSA